MSTESKMAAQSDSNEASEFSSEDLSRLFHYPSLGELFSDNDPTALDGFRSRLISTRDQLEKIVRHGSREEADKAGTAVSGINVTLDFLNSLQQMRVAESDRLPRH